MLIRFHFRLDIQSTENPALPLAVVMNCTQKTRFRSGKERGSNQKPAWMQLISSNLRSSPHLHGSEQVAEELTRSVISLFQYQGFGCHEIRKESHTTTATVIPSFHLSILPSYHWSFDPQDGLYRNIESRLAKISSKLAQAQHGGRDKSGASVRMLGTCLG